MIRGMETSKKIAEHGVVLVLYVVLAFVMSWPAMLHLSTEVIGVGGDPWQTMWRFGATAQDLHQAVATHQLLPYLQGQFLGGGENRLVNLAIWPWLWLDLLVGQPLAYNIVWLLSFVLSGYGMYLLGRYLLKKTGTGISWPAFIAGLYYMFLPFHEAHAQGHFGAMQMEWIPLIILLELYLWERFSWGKGVIFVGLCFIQAITDEHYMLWLLVLGIITIVAHRREVHIKLRQRQWLRSVIICALLTGLLVVLPYLPTLRLATQPNSLLALGTEQTVRFSADLFSFVIPAPWQSMWGNAFNSLFSKSFTGNPFEATQYLGITVLLAFLFFHRDIPKQQKVFWFWVAGIFGLIALGPQLHVFGHVTSIPLPYKLLSWLPIWSSIRTVGRAGAMVGLASSILLLWLLHTHRTNKGVLWLMGIGVLLEFLFIPVGLQSTALSPVYADVKAQMGSAILELPAGTNYTAASQALYASLFHGKTVLGDIALERQQSTDEFTPVKSAPGIRQLLFLRTTELRRDRSEFFNQSLPESLADALRYFDAGAIVIHTDSVSALQLAALRNFLEQDMGFTPRMYKDEVAYFFNPATLPVSSDGVFIMRDGNWQNVGFDPKRNSVFAEIPKTATITIVNIAKQTKTVTFSVTLAAESKVSAVLTAPGMPAATALPSQLISFTLPVPPGKTIVTFTAQGDGPAIIQNPSFTVQP